MRDLTTTKGKNRYFTCPTCGSIYEITASIMEEANAFNLTSEGKMSSSGASETIHIDDVIEKLNEMVKADQVAMHSLVEFRVPCKGIESVKGVKTMKIKHGAMGVGFLGVLNGLFENWEDGPIVAVFDCYLARFEKVKEDERTTKTNKKISAQWDATD